MSLVEKLVDRWKNIESPFLIHPDGSFFFDDILKQERLDLSQVKSGDVVALIGDYDPLTLSIFFRLIELNVIIVPLTKETLSDHNYFFETAGVQIVIEGKDIKKRPNSEQNALIESLRKKECPGLIAFSSGTTGRPKAILHDFSLFLKRFETPRPTLRTVNFLMFDHVGGLNTLFHTLFNGGVIIVPEKRSVESILIACEKHQAEVLPTTPTFLRMMLMSGLIPDRLSKSIKIISYGSERMDQNTLDEFCKLLPNVDFRQTFGTSELGVVRVKSKARDSLFMKIGDIGVETKVEKNILHLRSSNRMIGYLNAPSPFDPDGWYNTNDVIQEKDGFYKVVGRIGDVINVGGLKFMGSEVERVALDYEGITFVKAYAVPNPITGHHVELKIEPANEKKFNLSAYKKYMKSALPSHMMPKKFVVANIEIGNRFKKL